MIVFLEALGTNDYNRYAMCPAGQFLVVEITIKMKTVVRKPLMIKIKLAMLNSDKTTHEFICFPAWCFWFMKK